MRSFLNFKVRLSRQYYCAAHIMYEYALGENETFLQQFHREAWLEEAADGYVII
jgi:hypothetical protein